MVGRSQIVNISHNLLLLNSLPLFHIGLLELLRFQFFAEITFRNRMDPSSRTRAWMTAVLYLRGLWLKHRIKDNRG